MPRRTWISVRKPRAAPDMLVIVWPPCNEIELFTQNSLDDLTLHGLLGVPTLWPRSTGRSRGYSGRPGRDRSLFRIRQCTAGLSDAPSSGPGTSR